MRRRKGAALSEQAETIDRGICVTTPLAVSLNQDSLMMETQALINRQLDR